MVCFGAAELEKPPLSSILPRLYLGAESDVTQERLSALDVSYVLSVSVSSPRPAFVSQSRFLRVPIEDSLSAELLPWIKPALSFIDSALSSGSSVLVHCAAGISRSAALTVAYVMHRLDLDLDQAYRFVKERRPSISPNLNFLGQLQHFQSSLKPGAPPASSPEEPLPPPQTPAPPPGLPEALSPSLSQDFAHGRASSASIREKRKSLTLSLTPLHPGPPSTAPPVPELRPHSLAQPKEALLSPLSLTLSRLLSWGERWLLATPVRMGQRPLPYGC